MLWVFVNRVLQTPVLYHHDNHVPYCINGHFGIHLRVYSIFRQMHKIVSSALSFENSSLNDINSHGNPWPRKTLGFPFGHDLQIVYFLYVHWKVPHLRCNRKLHSLPVDEVDGRTSLFDPEHPDFGRFPNARKAQAARVMGVVDVMDVHKGRKCWNILDCFMGLNMLNFDFCSEEIRIFAQRFLLFTCPTPHLQTFGEAYSVVVEEGETVVLPARWWHWAKNLTPSITLMRRYAGWVGIWTFWENGKTCHLMVVIHHFQTLPAATHVFCLSKRIRWVL